MKYHTHVGRYERHNSRPAVIRPEMALVLSRVEGRRDVPPVVTYHRFTHEAGRPSMDRGRVVSEDGLAGLLTDLGVSAPAHWHDERTLATGTEQFVWYRPSVRHRMYWKVGGSQASLDVIWPSLIFAAAPNLFRVFALAGPERPTPSSRLYVAPIGNVGREGDMCWGSVSRPPCRLDHREAFEAAVYDTNFSHPNVPRCVNAKLPLVDGRQDLFRFWKERAGDRAAPLPKRLLLATDLMAGDLLL